MSIAIPKKSKVNIIINTNTQKNRIHLDICNLKLIAQLGPLYWALISPHDPYPYL